MNKVVADDEFEAQTRAFAERLAKGPTLAYAAGKRFVRAYLEDGIRAADKVVDKWLRRYSTAKICARELRVCSSMDSERFAIRWCFAAASGSC